MQSNTEAAHSQPSHKRKRDDERTKFYEETMDH